MGGSFGATCGLLLMQALPTWHIQPGIYAMCAATAMLGGVFRASISLVIIVVEGTQVLRQAVNELLLLPASCLCDVPASALLMTGVLEAVYAMGLLCRACC